MRIYESRYGVSNLLTDLSFVLPCLVSEMVLPNLGPVCLSACRHIGEWGWGEEKRAETGNRLFSSDFCRGTFEDTEFKLNVRIQGRDSLICSRVLCLRSLIWLCILSYGCSKSEYT